MRRYLAFGAVLFLALCFRAFGDYNATQGSGTIFRAFDAANGGSSLCAAANTQCQAVGLVNSAGAEITSLGAPADAACATDNGTCSLPALIKRTNQNLTTSTIGSGTAGSPASAVLSVQDPTDPCKYKTKTFTPISITTATTTRIVAPSASNRTYICNLFLTSAAADNIGIVEGTGGTCGTGTAGVIGGTTAANGPNFAANGGFSIGNGSATVAATAGTNVDLCLITSAATPLAGTIGWVQTP